MSSSCEDILIVAISFWELLTTSYLCQIQNGQRSLKIVFPVLFTVTKLYIWSCGHKKHHQKLGQAVGCSSQQQAAGLHGARGEVTWCELTGGTMGNRAKTPIMQPAETRPYHTGQAARPLLVYYYIVIKHCSKVTTGVKLWGLNKLVYP